MLPGGLTVTEPLPVLVIERSYFFIEKLAVTVQSEVILDIVYMAALPADTPSAFISST